MYEPGSVFRPAILAHIIACQAEHRILSSKITTLPWRDHSLFALGIWLTSPCQMTPTLVLCFAPFHEHAVCIHQTHHMSVGFCQSDGPVT